MKVALRLCPACGGELLGRPGLPWMTCRGCPVAFDPFASPAERLATYRPEGEAGNASLRLAFYVFDAAPDGGPGPIWIPAFRATDTSGLDVGEVLTQKKHAPRLALAPLGAGLARTPGEALTLLKLRRGTTGVGAEAPRPRLVSLPCRLLGERLTEPVSGVSFWLKGLRPPPGP
ncbi:MAG: hypothetical protein U0529_16730 [Thermoanaerobaculia bacterium]